MDFRVYVLRRHPLGLHTSADFASLFDWLLLRGLGCLYCTFCWVQALRAKIHSLASVRLLDFWGPQPLRLISPPCMSEGDPEVDSLTVLFGGLELTIRRRPGQPRTDTAEDFELVVPPRTGSCEPQITRLLLPPPWRP